MAGGSGGTTKTVSEPWKGAQPFLSEAFGMARGAAGAPPKFYPGQTFAGPTSGQLTGWDSQLQYADQVFGGQAAPKFGDATAKVDGYGTFKGLGKVGNGQNVVVRVGLAIGIGG